MKLRKISKKSAKRGMVANQIVIAIIVLIVVAVVLLFIFRVRIIEYIKALPSFKVSEEDVEITDIIKDAFIEGDDYCWKARTYGVVVGEIAGYQGLLEGLTVDDIRPILIDGVESSLVYGYSDNANSLGYIAKKSRVVTSGDILAEIRKDGLVLSDLYFIEYVNIDHENYRDFKKLDGSCLDGTNFKFKKHQEIIDNPNLVFEQRVRSTGIMSSNMLTITFTSYKNDDVDVMYSLIDDSVKMVISPNENMIRQNDKPVVFVSNDELVDNVNHFDCGEIHSNEIILDKVHGLERGAMGFLCNSATAHSFTVRLRDTINSDTLRDRGMKLNGVKISKKSEKFIFEDINQMLYGIDDIPVYVENES